MRRKSFQIALAALSCALATIFLTIGIYFSFFLITGYLFAGIALMLPLAKKFRLGGFLAYVATSLFALLIGGGFAGFYKLFPFVAFFGLHPLVNSFQEKWKIKKWIALIVKAVWFDAAVWAAWILFREYISVPFEWVDKWIWLIILVAGSAFFIFYDWVIFRCQRIVNYYVAKIDKSSSAPPQEAPFKPQSDDVFEELRQDTAAVGQEKEQGEKQEKEQEDGPDTGEEKKEEPKDGDREGKDQEQ